MSNIFPYIAIVFCLMGSAFFSGTEIAFTSQSKLKKKDEGELTPIEKRVNYITNHFDHALSTVLIGNNLVNIGATSIATVIAVNLANASGGKLSDDTASSIVTVLMTILILICGEITPKMIAKRKAGTIIKFAAYPLTFLMIVLYPAVLLTNVIVKFFKHFTEPKGGPQPTFTEQDLESILDTVEDEGIIDEAHTDLLQSALEFTDLDASDILTPRIDVIGFDINSNMEEVLKIIDENQFSRFPVYDRTIDHVVGILYVKHLLKELVENPDTTLRDLILEPIYIPRSMKLHAILNEFRAHQSHMAIVADEYGGTMGIVTMEDVLEQLVGEIWDENDDIVNEWQQLSETRFECSGDMNLVEFFDELDLDDRDLETQSATVGGWATEMIGAMPVEFDAFDYKQFTVLVKHVDENHRISRLLILKHVCEDD